MSGYTYQNPDSKVARPGNENWMQRNLDYRENSYFPLDRGDVDLSFDEWQVEEFDRLWREGYCLLHISRYLKRDPDEVAVLLIDRKRYRHIKARPGGVMGDCGQECLNLLIS